MPLPEEINPNECKNVIRNFIRANSPERKQNTFFGFLTFFDRLSFQVQTRKNRTPVNVIKLNTVNSGVFTYQPNNYDWTTSTEKSETRCFDDQESLIDEDSWSLIIENIQIL